MKSCCKSPATVAAAAAAEWIRENLQEELGFPDKADKRVQPRIGWAPEKLNNVLQNHLVNSVLTTFGCVEWESDLFRCYPFDMTKRRFHYFSQKVFNTYFHITC